MALWAEEVASLVATHGGGNRRLAVDRCDPAGTLRLHARGIELIDVQGPIELARCIKSPEEIQCLQASMDVCDVAIGRMQEALRPGITENQLWAILHETNAAHGGEWIECRLLASGPRTNPWFQECADRPIEPGDSRRLRHRHGRPQRLPRRRLPHLHLPRQARPPTASAHSSRRRKSRSNTTWRCSAPD